MSFFEFTKTDYDYIVKECMLKEEAQSQEEVNMIKQTAQRIAQM